MVRTRSFRRSPRAVAALVGACLAVVTLAGCSSTVSDLRQAASDARSAVSSANLAMSQQARARTFLPTTQTVLGDAITELGSAEQAAAEVEPDGAVEESAQQRTLTAIREATDAVLAAQRTVADDAASGVPALRASTKELTALADRLLKAEGRG
ncbi:hypothetical protein [Leifsonia aquatica]|uniref:hypothetical protein n=1 Tax=Leifsonia aquatica TaxID=144185 RepID=UPI0028A67009|nr:hypothetical protein [Leifsonia aquatica]